jgi:hypothetical protein
MNLRQDIHGSMDVDVPLGSMDVDATNIHGYPSSAFTAQCAPLFFETIVDYGIEQKIGYITSDNATCNDTMMSHLATLLSERLSIDWDPLQHRTRCFDHQPPTPNTKETHEDNSKPWAVNRESRRWS